MYASTHIGYSDIIMAFEAIKSPCWLIVSEPEDITIHLIDGLLKRMV